MNSSTTEVAKVALDVPLTPTWHAPLKSAGLSVSSTRLKDHSGCPSGRWLWPVVTPFSSLQLVVEKMVSSHHSDARTPSTVPPKSKCSA